eukprot:1780320-Prymnesium_polylepis.1
MPLDCTVQLKNATRVMSSTASPLRARAPPAACCTPDRSTFSTRVSEMVSSVPLKMLDSLVFVIVLITPPWAPPRSELTYTSRKEQPAKRTFDSSIKSTPPIVDCLDVMWKSSKVQSVNTASQFLICIAPRATVARCPGAVEILKMVTFVAIRVSVHTKQGLHPW